VRIEYDADKSARNEEIRGLSFDLVDGFDWDSAMVLQDTRRAYPEPRYQAIGLLGKRLHVVVFTPIADGIRVISLRRANSREGKRYEQIAPKA
jgi:uncharacterized DUF497 family protein